MNKPVPSFPKLSTEEIEELVRAIRDAPDTYAKMEAMEPYVAFGERRKLLWELTRTGALPTWDEPELWSELANGYAWADGQDVVDFLSKIESYDTLGYESQRLVEYWPISLDDLVCLAYADDPEPIEESCDLLPETICNGLRLVLRRFEAIEEEDLPTNVLDDLATQHIDGGGLPNQVKMVRNEELVDVDLHDHLGPKPGLYQFIELFGSKEDWGRAVLEHTLAAEPSPPFFRTYDAWLVASISELEQLLEKSDAHARSREVLYDIILERREDSPEELVEMAEAFRDEGTPGPEPEMAAVAAILKWKREGRPVPEGVEELLDFHSVGKPMHMENYEGLEPLVEAVRYVPRERVARRMEELFAGEYTRMDPFPVLQAVATNEELVDRAFDAAETAAKGERGSFTGLHPVAYGLAMAGNDIIDRLVEEYDAAKNPLLRDTYHRAIVHYFASRAKHGLTVEEKYEGFLSFVAWESRETDDHNFDQYLSEDLEILFANMPKKRAERLLLEQVGSPSERWPRVLEGVRHHPTDKLIDAVFDRIADEGLPAAGGYNWLKRFLEAMGDRLLPKLGKALVRADSPQLHTVVNEVFGEERYVELLGEYGDGSRADEAPADRIRRLAGEALENEPGRETTPIYLFRRDDERTEETLNRVGGRPVGLGLSEWPQRAGEENGPMEHMVTLDLETVPALASRVPSGARAVSLFVHSPEVNEAWRPFNDDVEVVLLRESEVESGYFEGDLPAGEAEGASFTVDQVDVPVAAFQDPAEIIGEDRDPIIEELHEAIYESPARAGGAPIWVQGDASPSSNFLFQFDDEFVPMNLGDMGIMYVFAETAFWQCH